MRYAATLNLPVQLWQRLAIDALSQLVLRRVLPMWGSFPFSSSVVTVAEYNNEQQC